jgi:hypothetical protein
MNGCPTPQKFADFGNGVKDVGRDVVGQFVALTLIPIVPLIKSDKKSKTTILLPQVNPNIFCNTRFLLPYKVLEVFNASYLICNLKSHELQR